MHTVGEWEACTIVADHGTTCDVCITSDGDLCKGVQRRHLQPVARAVGKRAAAAAERERLLRSKPARSGRHGLRSAKAFERRHGMRCMNMSSVHSFMTILG